MKEDNKKLDIADLNRIYDEAETADKEIFAEYRSNVLLIEGTHYSKRSFRDRPNLRDSRDLSYDHQKLRITKNHMHRAVRHYVANILSHAPDVTIVPQDETSMQDKKSAELNHAVKQYFDYKYRMREKTREWCDDFVGIGEVAVKIFWDPNAGDLKGYEGTVDEDGQPVLDDQGQQVADEKKPVFTGGFVHERIFGMNLLRHASAKDMKEASCLIVRKMAEVSHLKAVYKDDPEKVKFIHESRDETYVVFDSTKTTYTQTKNQTMVREFYYRPCYEYPEGYYFITTSEGILEDGPLPFGIFPIIWTGFDIYPTTPRGRGIIKIARPFQAEINRASSAQAMHQVTLGDDKILYQAGTKLAPGAMLPGVRGITFQGSSPTILEGRSGAQYQDYIANTIVELDRVLMIEEINQEKASTMDPTALLFRSIAQKAKFGQYGIKFEQFLIDVWELKLKLAKKYLPDDLLIPAIGKSEVINISEFKSTSELCTQVKILPMEDTLETQMGKQINFQHILQYVGQQLTKDQIGMVIREMPFGNIKDATKSLTIDYDIVENDMLALERGAVPQPTPNVDPAYVLKRLDLRMKMADFSLLDPQIQQNYSQFHQQIEQIMSQQQEAVLAAKNQFIPANGALIACDMYVPDEKNPQAAAKRIRVPYQALDWLVKTLQSQGMSQQALEQLDGQTKSEVAQQLLQHAQGAGAGPSQPPMQ